MSETDDHESNLRAAVKSHLTDEPDASYFDVLSKLGSADPREVWGIWTAESPREHVRQSGSLTCDTPGVGGSALPVSDPSRGQWWFTESTNRWLAQYVAAILAGCDIDGDNRVLVLGAPSVAIALGAARISPTVLDVDPAVLEAVQRLHTDMATLCYDVSKELPDDLQRSFDIVVLDPPWYQPIMDTFVHRALSSLKPGGHMLTTLPGRHTRPKVRREKREFLRKITSAALDVEAYMADELRYRVPRFESCAFSDLMGFGRPWRRSDFLHVHRRPTTAASDIDGLRPSSTPGRCETGTRSREPNVFRVFFNLQTEDGVAAKSSPIFEGYAAYRSEVSRRKTAADKYNVWTSEQRAGRASCAVALSVALDAWEKSDGGRDTAIKRLVAQGVDEAAARVFVEKLDEELQLWSRFHTPKLRRDDMEIAEAKKKALSERAVDKPRQQREHKPVSDNFRAEFQRDRDRLIWSKNLRRLANKTQLFPVARNDQLRQRLTHSLEVMQLASTIGDAFGLNRDLVEAGALAHDIGHTPFGHAGEYALDVLIDSISSDLGGFNHYEHGVDVVRYLDDAYQQSGGTGHIGLDLTDEVYECILKHTFCHVDQKQRADRESVWKTSKHKDKILKGHAHLEGQAIRLGDKISYLISDLEDGILLGAISRADLVTCRLFHYPSIDFADGATGDDLYPDFVAQRGNILRIIMEDAIRATEARLAKLGPKSNVRDNESLVVNHSEEMGGAVAEVWSKLQMGRLHRDARVLMANMRAARIVTELTILFTLFPNLVEPKFESAYRRVRGSDYMKFYTAKAGNHQRLPQKSLDFLPLETMIEGSPSRGSEIETVLLVQAKDYVASLTDDEAKFLHHKFIASYSDRA